MYLKTIKAKGFKSFADQTELDFTNEINGIVGPNGSGKSNVVDAIRWVLGEQSVKSLRGESTMTDVIFSGSKSRQPMNMASVSLIFDNKDNYFPISYDEIEIKRRVYKDGIITSVNEGMMKFKGNILFTSHDHQLTQTVANRIIDIKSDKIIDRECTYNEYLGIE